MEMNDRGPRRSRRAVLGAALGFVGAAAGLKVRDAAAGRTWCRTDPIVLIGGQLVDIFVAGPLAALLKVTGPNQIVITVPAGVDALLVLNDLGFGRGNVTTFQESADLHATADGIEVQVDVYVPAKEALPIRVDFAPRILGILWPASAEGTANSWVSLRASL